MLPIDSTMNLLLLDWKLLVVNSLLGHVVIVKKDFRMDVFKIHWDKPLNLVYYLINKYLAINSLCSNRVRSY